MRMTNHTLANMKDKNDWNNCYKKYLQQQKHLTLGEMYKKLSDYEDIEEELGIDLILFSKIIKQQFVFMKIDKKIISKYEFIGINFNQNNALILYNEDNQEMYTSDLYFKDYGTTWALTKEELQ